MKMNEKLIVIDGTVITLHTSLATLLTLSNI